MHSLFQLCHRHLVDAFINIHLQCAQFKNKLLQHDKGPAASVDYKQIHNMYVVQIQTLAASFSPSLLSIKPSKRLSNEFLS